jgi:hypothetical protein
MPGYGQIEPNCALIPAHVEADHANPAAKPKIAHARIGKLLLDGPCASMACDGERRNAFASIGARRRMSGAEDGISGCVIS